MEVQFKLFREGSDNYFERIYVAVVDEHGQVIDDQTSERQRREDE